MFRMLMADGGFHEVCDECGFHGGTLDLTATVARLRALPEQWADVLSQDEQLVRTRPEPATFCAVEYAQHVVNAIASIEWATRRYAEGIAPNWDELPEDTLPGVFEHETHDCERFGIQDTLASIRHVVDSLAACTESLTPEQRSFVALYDADWVIDTTAVVRHALHDAEHHVLDARRGIARILLRD